MLDYRSLKLKHEFACSRDVHGIAKRKDKALAATMIILAVVTSSIAIGSNIMSTISDKVRGGHGARTSR